MNKYENLTQEEKQFYADVLNYIFKGTIGNIQAYQIRPNVAKATDFLISEIMQCSKGITNALVGIPSGVMYSVIFNIVLGKTKYKDMPFIKAFILEQITSYMFGELVKLLVGHPIYSPCVNKVNINWKSQMGLLLADFIDEL